MVDSMTPPAPGSSDDDKPRSVHPAGLVQAVLVDVIDLGDKVDSYPGTPEKLVHKGAFVYQSSKINPDTQRPFELSWEFSLSWGEKANLRKWLGAQRGEPYSDAELKRPPNLASFVGTNALLTVTNPVSKGKGRVYAKVIAAAPLMEGMPPLKPSAEYKRAPFWEAKKEEYRQAAAAFTRAAHKEPDAADNAARSADLVKKGDFRDFPAPLAADDNSDLPFSPMAK